MKRRKSKKLFKPGTLVTIQGTHCVFMSLGLKGNNELESINGINLETKRVVKECNGKARPSTKREAALYWDILRYCILPGGK